MSNVNPRRRSPFSILDVWLRWVRMIALPRIMMVKRMPGYTVTAAVVCRLSIVIVIADGDYIVSGVVMLLNLEQSVGQSFIDEAYQKGEWF